MEEAGHHVPEKIPGFHEYGFGTDHTGARRQRRAFRLAVFACILFTMVLWFADNYKRYDLLETKYRISLTLHEESAWPVLRQVIKRDREINDPPSAKYLEAMAMVEEPEEVLNRFEQAYELNSNSASLIILYGCSLFQDGQYKEARERFREAAIQPQKNALPRYLEAAALAASISPTEGMSEVMDLIALTNNSGAPIIFPQPLWHASLPKKGVWYAEKHRDIVVRCCAPLYSLKGQIISRGK
jgi:tetratricopeptide (TPR) repeat protein